jgi:protein-disulfide isomerase
MSKSGSPFSFESAVSMLSENFLIVVLVLISFLAGFFVGSIWTENELLRSGGAVGSAAGGAAAGQVADAAPEPEIEKLPEITDADHILGSRDAAVIIVEYSDMNCPFCRRFHTTMKQVVEDYNGQVAWVYRHFAFQTQDSSDAAALSECIAATEGNEAFWDFTDSLFAKADAAGSLSRALLVEAAADVGLSEAQATECIASEEYQQIVTEQREGGSAAGVTGTPASILVTADGGPQEFISGALPIDQIKATIDQYL